jgi:hypothetical protein
MVKFAELDRLVVDGPPFARVVAIVQINLGPANEVIAEQHVVIVSLDHERLRARHRDVELEHFVEFGVWLVQLILVASIHAIFATIYDDIRIRKGAFVPLREIESLQQIEACDALLWVLEHIKKPVVGKV